MDAWSAYTASHGFGAPGAPKPITAPGHGRSLRSPRGPYSGPLGSPSLSMAWCGYGDGRVNPALNRRPSGRNRASAIPAAGPSVARSASACRRSAASGGPMAAYARPYSPSAAAPALAHSLGHCLPPPAPQYFLEQVPGRIGVPARRSRPIRRPGPRGPWLAFLCR